MAQNSFLLHVARQYFPEKFLEYLHDMYIVFLWLVQDLENTATGNNTGPLSVIFLLCCEYNL